jgi:Tfp pilus assembly protein PilF
MQMGQDHFEAAINTLRTALNDQPQSSELMMLLGAAYEGNGAIELAEKQYSDALRVSNFSPSVGLSYLSFLRRRGAEDRAENLLTQLAERWPQNIEILSKLAEVKLVKKDWAGAQALAEKIKILPGGITTADELLGSVLIEQDKVSQGIDLLQKAYAATPSATAPMLTLVRAYVRTKQPDKATALLQNLLQKDPANAEAYVLLGNIQAANNSSQQAIDSFRKAIEKQPSDIAGYRALAGFYLSQDNIPLAQQVIRQGLDHQPDSFDLHLLWASTLERQGDYDGAIHEYETMLPKNPGSLILANNLASVLANHKTDKASLERAKSLAVMLQKSPVPQFKDTLGWVDYQNGDYKNAVPLLEQASVAMPNQADFHYHLGMSYIAVAELDKASEQLNIAMKESPDPELLNKIRAGLKSIAAKQ